MKRVLTYLFAAGMMISAASLLFTSCTKEGPQGPPGAAGKDGTDANATCTQCHNFSDDIVARIFQYDASQHATGAVTTRNQSGCAGCHTGQGFREIIITGNPDTEATIQNPVPIGCRTCHMIHDTYTASDWALRTVAPITLRMNGQTLDLAFDGGVSNLCAVCHQPRARTPWPAVGGTEPMVITSGHWGPHYGTQSVILAGMGAFEGINGKIAFPNSPHRNIASCGTCHMADAYSNLSGGHTWWMTDENGRENTAGCEAADCHPDIESFDYDGVQTEVEEKMHHLADLLETAGYIDDTWHIIPGTYAQNDLCAIYNFFLVEYDRSLGVHN
ncbi:MAG: hypothetical protein ABIK52_04945, partial [Bacteroidota bacterium]